jgi:hemin uptake protein HemP
MIASSNTPSPELTPLASSTPTQNARRNRSVAVVGNELNSRELFGTDREILIVHGSDRYRLRLTSQNKLILTK